MHHDRMPRGILRNGSGEETEIEDYAAYYYYLNQVARRVLKGLRDTDELEKRDILIVVENMRRLLKQDVYHAQSTHKED